MSDAVTTDDLVAWIRAFRDAVQAHRDELTALDSAIGDADHGSNMARGLDAVVAKLETPPASPAELFKTVGMTLVSSVGGASGPLYGTFFLRIGPALTDPADAAALGAALRAGTEGVVARGKAEPGDKTMVDAQLPALAAWEDAVASGADAAGAAAAAARAAEQGRDATEPLVARKGRASYLGERSAGHIDPGAASSALLFRTLSDTLAARG
ncbi:dihydroxyacetone kinase subunit DhaL [Microbacterium sp. SLBN-111]|uniref:dihydroxyacetone kinase subunit DhaL n=1 Tax=Microbacterium sp. SLBN-111 TaxID=3377733 RepID=UPI003C7326AD